MATIGVVLPSEGSSPPRRDPACGLTRLPLVVNIPLPVCGWRWRHAGRGSHLAVVARVFRGAGANGLCVGALALSLLGVSAAIVTLGALGLGLLPPPIRRRV